MIGQDSSISHWYTGENFSKKAVIIDQKASHRLRVKGYQNCIVPPPPIFPGLRPLVLVLVLVLVQLCLRRSLLVLEEDFLDTGHEDMRLL